jgi:acyl carrier protein
MLGNWFGEDNMARDLDAMRAWLIERISKALKVKGAMDPDAPLSKYGLQSIDAVILAMEIEEEVGVELPPTLLWEYNTANECAAYLMTLGPAVAAWRRYRSPRCQKTTSLPYPTSAFPRWRSSRAMWAPRVLRHLQGSSKQHGDEADRPIADARRLPEGAVRQHLWSL